MTSFNELKTGVFVRFLPGRKFVKTKWDFDAKQGYKRKVVRCKVWLVAKKLTLVKGIYSQKVYKVTRQLTAILQFF